MRGTIRCGCSGSLPCFANVKCGTPMSFHFARMGFYQPVDETTTAAGDSVQLARVKPLCTTESENTGLVLPQ